MRFAFQEIKTTVEKFREQLDEFINIKNNISDEMKNEVDKLVKENGKRNNMFLIIKKNLIWLKSDLHNLLNLLNMWDLGIIYARNKTKKIYTNFWKIDFWKTKNFKGRNNDNVSKDNKTSEEYYLDENITEKNNNKFLF